MPLTTLTIAHMPLNADSFCFDGIHCFIAGQGPPLRLVHSINAAGSAAEVRPLVEHFHASMAR